MKKVFLVYGHYNEKSFNSAIKNVFIKSAEEKGHSVECIDLYKEKFNPVYAGEKADEVVLLALLDRNEWYILAAKDECFVFWVSLEPDRFIELIDGGSIAKDQGIWRKD